MGNFTWDFRLDIRNLLCNQVLIGLITFIVCCSVLVYNLEVAGSIPVTYWEKDDSYDIFGYIPYGVVYGFTNRSSD